MTAGSAAASTRPRASWSLPSCARIPPGWRSIPSCIACWLRRARVHGEELADHMAAMLRAERAHAMELIDAGPRRRRDGRAGAGGGAGADPRRRSGGVRQRGTAGAAGDRCQRAVRRGCVARLPPPAGEHRPTPARWPRRGVSRRRRRSADGGRRDAARRGGAAWRCTTRWCACRARVRRCCWRWRVATPGRSIPRRAAMRWGSSAAPWPRRSGAEPWQQRTSPSLGGVGREADQGRGEGFSSTVPRLDYRHP